MPSFSLEENYPAINASANAFLRRLPGSHIETDIAGAASIAGLALLRATGVDLSQLEPGSVVLVDWVNEPGMEVSSFMVQVAAGMGLDPKTGWSDPVPATHQPAMTVLDLTRLLEAPFLEVCRETNGSRPLHPYIASLAAMKLVSAGASMKLLDPEIGKALAIYYLVAGSKTVPFSSPDDAAA